MALIKCPECQKEVSDTNHKCPNCGFVLKIESNIVISREINTLKVISSMVVLASIPVGIISGNFLVFSGMMAFGIIFFAISRFTDF